MTQASNQHVSAAANSGGLSPVRIGVIGAGAFGMLHIQTLAGLGEAHLTAVVDGNAQTRTAVQKLLPGIQTYENLTAALDADVAQAWVIATRTPSHVALAKQVLERGGSVLIEKPLAENLPAARSLGEMVHADSSNLMLGHLVLFAPEFEALLKEIKQRGPVRYFHAVRHRPTMLRERFHEENPFTLTMVHDLYLALAMTQGQLPASMDATIQPHPQGGHATAMAHMHWADGCWGAFTASFLTPPGMAEDGYDRLEVFGDGWAAATQLNPRPIQVWDTQARWPLSLDIHCDANLPTGWLAQELRRFCRVVQGKAAVPLGARYEDGLQLMHWLDTLQEIAFTKLK